MDFKSIAPATWEVRETTEQGVRVWTFDNCVRRGGKLADPQIIRIESYGPDGRATFFWRKPPAFRGKPKRELWAEAHAALVAKLC